MQSNEFDKDVKAIKWSENGIFNICYGNNWMFILKKKLKMNRDMHLKQDIDKFKMQNLKFLEKQRRKYL